MSELVGFSMVGEINTYAYIYTYIHILSPIGRSIICELTLPSLISRVAMNPGDPLLVTSIYYNTFMYIYINIFFMYITHTKELKELVYIEQSSKCLHRKRKKSFLIFSFDSSSVREDRNYRVSPRDLCLALRSIYPWTKPHYQDFP